MSSSQFTHFIHSQFRPFYSKGFVEELVRLYVSPDLSFEPQKVYSEIITDATTLCPSIHFGKAISAGSSRRVYIYGASQRMSTPPGFCALRKFNDFDPPYCPEYSFHAVDVFALMSPYYDSNRFDYHFSAEDQAFGELVGSRLVEFAANGYVKAWPEFNQQNNYAAVELKVPEQNVPHFQHNRCTFWLSHGFYDKIGLIN